jgi:hypothetical protein
VLNGRFVLRLAIGNYRTQIAHLTRVWQILSGSPVI